MTESNQSAPEQSQSSLMVPGWQEARQLLHIYSQIIGKIRLKLHPKTNHWWHATLNVTTVGWSTGLIPYEKGSFEIEVNFIKHRLIVRKSDGNSREMTLNSPTVAAFHDDLFSCLNALGIYVSIVEMPFDKTKVKSIVPFNKDNATRNYNPEFAQKLWLAQLEAAIAFQTFRGRFIGKSSPVQLFWHSFDLAVTFFSGKNAPDVPGMDPVSKEAYSHEVISFGFWPGDDVTPFPAFYSYVYPEPATLTQKTLYPANASWVKTDKGTLAILKHSDVEQSGEAKEVIMGFMESVFKAGCDCSQWSKELANLRAREETRH